MSVNQSTGEDRALEQPPEQASYLLYTSMKKWIPTKTTVCNTEAPIPTVKSYITANCTRGDNPTVPSSKSNICKGPF